MSIYNVNKRIRFVQFMDITEYLWASFDIFYNGTTEQETGRGITNKLTKFICITYANNIAP